MVSLKKKTISKKTYYYIEHSYRKNGVVLKKEKYLGTKIPKNIDKLKEDLLLELYEGHKYIFFASEFLVFWM